jgi:hypothetical protein
MVIVAGAVGTVNNVFNNLADLFTVVPQGENALTLILSVVNAAKVDAYLTKIILEFVASPESTTTPLIPPTEIGNVQLYPTALVTAAAV